MTLHAVAAQALRPLLVLALLAVVLVGFAVQPASAHERREVGPFTFVVGFDQEPAFSHIPNAVDLTITETESEEPFVDLTDALDVEVSFGDESMTMTMRPLFRVGVYGTPGEYGAHFVPSRPGQYTFRFHGTVGDEEIDETFVSGPDTFNDVDDISEAMFPAQDPTTGELAERLERELARLNERLDELGTEHGDMAATEEVSAEQETASGQQSDGVARALAGGALLAGLAGLGLALTRRTT